MKQQVFAIFDRQTAQYQQPFFQPTPGAAERVIHQEVQRADSMLNLYATDYELWKLGTYDLDTGEFETDKQMLCNCGQLKQRGEQQ